MKNSYKLAKSLFPKKLISKHWDIYPSNFHEVLFNKDKIANFRRNELSFKFNDSLEKAILSRTKRVLSRLCEVTGKEFIEKNIPFNLATDYNPGSSPSGNMNFVSSLGSIKLKLSSEQVINATTINGAYAMELHKEIGTISIGKKANFFITKQIPSYQYLNYSFGENLINKVFLRGKEIK